MWLILVGIIAFAAYTGMVWTKASELGVAQYQKKEDEANAKLKDLADKLVAEGKNHIDDMVEADKVGFERGKLAAAKAKTQGDKYVAANAAFNNLVCNIGDDLVHLINSESAAMRTPTAPVYGDGTVPVAPAPSGRPDANSGGTPASGPEPGRPLGTVPPKPRPVDSAGQIPR